MKYEVSGEELSQRFTSRVVNWMRITGYNANELARLLDISVSMMSQILSGAKKPGLELLARVMSITQMTAEELLGGGFEPPGDDLGTLVRQAAEHHGALGMYLRRLYQVAEQESSPSTENV